MQERKTELFVFSCFFRFLFALIMCFSLFGFSEISFIVHYTTAS
jgi:hypothetical protein